MNETQRQLLADRLDAIMREIAARSARIEKEERYLGRQKAIVAKLEAEKAELEKGVDWNG